MKRNPGLAAVGAFAVACACAPMHSAQAQDSLVPVEVVIARALPRATAKATRVVGGLLVIVRNVDKPEDVVQGATVVLDSARGFITKADGMGRFGHLPAGDYTLSFRRIGFAPIRARVTVSGGCEARLEVYLPIVAVCLFDCPPSSPRVVLTTCRSPE